MIKFNPKAKFKSGLRRKKPQRVKQQIARTQVRCVVDHLGSKPKAVRENLVPNADQRHRPHKSCDCLANRLILHKVVTTKHLMPSHLAGNNHEGEQNTQSNCYRPWTAGRGEAWHSLPRGKIKPEYRSHIKLRSRSKSAASGRLRSVRMDGGRCGFAG